jgi:hypothetical protein
VVSVQSGRESLMVVAARNAVAIAAISFLVLCFGDAAHSQNATPAKILAISEGEAGSARGPGSCGTEMKTEAARQRFNFAGAPYLGRPATDPRHDPCGNIGTPAGGFSSEDERIQRALLALGKQGETISRVRDQVLNILETENSCTAWFQEADADPAGTFRSVDFALEENGPSYIFAKKETGQDEIFKHPRVASSTQNTGRNTTIRLNANGAFFKRASAVLEQDRKGGPLQPGGMHELRVASYVGNSAPAQITALLHEFGHIIGRLPEDDDSWDGQSARNTAEVLRHCRSEIRSAARKPPRRPGTYGQEKTSPF